MKEESKNKVDEKKRPLRWLWRSLLFLTLLILFLFFMAAALLYVPIIQNITADRLVQTYSKQVNGDIAIGQVSLSLFKGLVLDDFIIIGEQGDTLIAVNKLNAGLAENLLSLRRRKVNISSVELNSLTINDAKGTTSPLTALGSIFVKSAVGQSSSKQTKKPFDVKISELVLNNFEYNYTDSIRGETRHIFVSRAKVEIDSFNLAQKDFYLSNVIASKPTFELTFFEKSEANFQEQSVVIDDESYEVPDTFDLFIEQAKISDGLFLLHDTSREKHRVAGEFDPAHIEAKNINIELEDFYANALAEVKASISSGSLTSIDEVVRIESFVCDSFELKKRRMSFEGLELATPDSRLADRLIFKFRSIKDFNDFNNKVIMEGNIASSTVGIEELLYFAPALKNSQFFMENKSRRIDIEGAVFGRVNNLNSPNVSIRFGNEIVVKGRMNSRNLADVSNALLNLDLKEFSVTVATLSQLIPGFTPPTNFYKLGRIKFDGRFDGYFQDFVAFGDLSSDLGRASLDMRLDLKEGVENAQYSGRAVLKEFDLASWSGNSDFGLLEAEAEVRDGKGLSLELVNADLQANVNSLEYKGYTYRDFKMEGKFEQNLFDGDFEIADPNINLNFSGTIDFTDSIPVYDFNADVKALKLQKLKIIEEDFALEGNLIINANGTDINNAQGTASGTEFIFYKDGKEFKLDSFDLRAKGAFPDRRNFVLNSSLADVELNGFFKLEELPDAFILGLKRNYPKFTKQLTFIKYPNPTPGFDFNINMTIRESEDIFEVLLGQSIFIRDASILGRISDEDNRSALDITFPFLEVNGNVFGGIKGDLFAQAEEGQLKMLMEYANINGVEFSPIQLTAGADQEELRFSLSSVELLDSFSNVSIDGAMRTTADRFKVSLVDTQFDAFGSRWKFNNGNSVSFGADFIEIENLILSDGERALSFEDIGKKGVGVNIRSLKSSFFNRLLSADFRGDINGSIEVKDVFDFEGLTANLGIESFGFKNHEFGKILFTATSEYITNPINYTLIANDGEKYLELDGNYDVKAKENIGELKVNNYPLDLLEYIIADGISETSGTVYAAVKFEGPLAYPEVEGVAEVVDGFSKIDYLGTRYKVGENEILLSKGYIDFSGGKLIDSRNQEAIVQGGLRHAAFRDFFADLRIRSPKFIALNTTKQDNPSYYGFAQGELDVVFDGPFETILITVTATTGNNTVLNLPVEYTAEEYSTDFIEIVKIDQGEPMERVSREDIDLKGLSLDMNVNVTQDAKVVILFDETAKDILESSGRGAIQLSIDPEGNFEMFGNYEVVSGQYLFTIPSLLVNKSFIIQNGGSIEWTGDPLDANLNIDATYRNLQASLNLFLLEYLPDESTGAALVNQAKQKTDVSLTMDLGGTMSTPDIDFDISFPNLTGELKPLADGRLRTLESNQDAYNEQVFGLILLRTFLPPNQVGSNIINSNNIIGTTYSTISEFVSNQFSILLSSIFDEALEGNSSFSGVDVNFAANKNILGLQSSGFLPDEYDINLVSSFNENKWNVQLGGRYVVNSVFDVDEYFAPDFVVEYFITDDRRLKLNLYARSDYDATNLRKLQSGIGLTYRKEFNTLFDFAREVNAEAQQKEAL